MAAAPPRRALHFPLDRLDFERVADRCLQPVGRCRLDDEIESTVTHGRNDGLDATLGGLHDDRNLDAALTHCLQHADAVEARHDEVEDDHRDAARIGPVERVETGLAAIRDDRAVAEFRHRRLEQPALHGIVIDYEYGTCHDWFNDARPICPPHCAHPMGNPTLWIILAQGSK